MSATIEKFTLSANFTTLKVNNSAAISKIASYVHHFYNSLFFYLIQEWGAFNF